MHALAAADARARAMDARLVIAHPAGSVLRLLELTGSVRRLRWSKGPCRRRPREAASRHERRVLEVEDGSVEDVRGAELAGG